MEWVNLEQQMKKLVYFASAGLKTDYRDENDQTALTGNQGEVMCINHCHCCHCTICCRAMGQEESVYGLPHTYWNNSYSYRPIGVLLGINKGIGRCNLAGNLFRKGYISHPCNVRVPIK